MRCGQFAGRIDDLHPHRDERTVAHRGQELAALRWTALALQDPAEVGVEGHDEDLLGRLGPVFAPIPGRHADLLPVGGPVACTVVACRVHERLAEHRPAAVALLPRPRKPAHRHRKGPGGEIVDPDPGKNEEPAVRDRKMQSPVALRPAPSEPRIAGRQRPCRRFEQQAAKAAPFAVENEPAQVRSERTGAAKPVVSVNQFVPLGDLSRLRRQMQRQRLQIGQAAGDLRPRVGPFGVLDRPARPRCGVALRRQAQDPAFLQALEHAQAGRDPVVALRSGPVQVLADRLGQLVAAQGREQGHGLLDIGNLAPRQAAAEKRGGLEVLDSRIHRSGSPCETDMVESVMPCEGARVNCLFAIPAKIVERVSNQRFGTTGKI